METASLSVYPSLSPPWSLALRHWLEKNISLLLTGVVVAVYILFFIRLFRRMLMATVGEFIYPLDDTYITMAIAKNFASHGAWSLTNNSFDSSTSTPGFLLLLAGLYRITGPSVWTPLVLSFTFGLLALFAAHRLMDGIRPTVEFVALLVIAILTPLPILATLGMEHTLHVLLVFVFLQLIGHALSKREPPGWGLLLLAAAMVSVRYESLFMVGVASLLLFAQRQFRAAVALASAGAAPVALYAVISIAHGCYWLPHTIALKGYSAEAGIFGVPIGIYKNFAYCLSHAPYMGVLIAVMILLLTMRRVREDKRARATLCIVAGAALLHLALASVEWVYRYEAYVIAASFAAIACALPLVELWPPRWALLGIIILGSMGLQSLMARAFDADQSIPDRSYAIYCQQIQMARFLSRFAQGATVAANDVGAIIYFADIDCVDLVGIGDKTIFWLKRRRGYSTAALSEYMVEKHVKFAIVYDRWFHTEEPQLSPGPYLPRSWVRVERWRTPGGEYLGDSRVSFYAVDPKDAGQLKHSLDLFAPSLPPPVQILP